MWPIKYPKPAARGELVVEPATEQQKYRKRPRQTRLDGYLSKARSAKQSSRILNLSGRASQSSHAPTTSTAQLDADYASSLHDSDSDGKVYSQCLTINNGTKKHCQVSLYKYSVKIINLRES